ADSERNLRFRGRGGVPRWRSQLGAVNSSVTAAFVVSGISLSRPADPVETGGMIHPLRIAEIEQAIGKVAALQRNPRQAPEVRAGFHDDRNIGCPDYSETKSVRSQAETKVAGLHLWVP